MMWKNATDYQIFLKKVSKFMSYGSIFNISWVILKNWRISSDLLGKIEVVARNTSSPTILGHKIVILKAHAQKMFWVNTDWYCASLPLIRTLSCITAYASYILCITFSQTLFYLYNFLATLLLGKNWANKFIFESDYWNKLLLLSQWNRIKGKIDRWAKAAVQG